MAFEVNGLNRIFVYKGNKLEDPADSMSLEQVKDFFTATYPELNNSSISAPEVVGEKLQYTFAEKSLGTKG